jgi:hypothetical protein
MVGSTLSRGIDMKMGKKSWDWEMRILEYLVYIFQEIRVVEIMDCWGDACDSLVSKLSQEIWAFRRDFVEYLLENMGENSGVRYLLSKEEKIEELSAHQREAVLMLGLQMDENNRIDPISNLYLVRVAICYLERESDNNKKSRDLLAKVAKILPKESLELFEFMDYNQSEDGEAPLIISEC